MNNTTVQYLNKVTRIAEFFKSYQQSVEHLTAQAVQYELSIRNIDTSITEADIEVNRAHLETIFKKENGDPSQRQRPDKLIVSQELAYLEEEIDLIQETLAEYGPTASVE